MSRKLPERSKTKVKVKSKILKIIVFTKKCNHQFYYFSFSAFVSKKTHVLCPVSDIVSGMRYCSLLVKSLQYLIQSDFNEFLNWGDGVCEVCLIVGLGSIITIKSLLATVKGESLRLEKGMLELIKCLLCSR